MKNLDPANFRFDDFPQLVKTVISQGEEIDRLKSIIRNFSLRDLNYQQLSLYLKEKHNTKIGVQHIRNLVYEDKIPFHYKLDRPHFKPELIDQWLLNRKAFMIAFREARAHCPDLNSIDMSDIKLNQ